MEWTCETEKGTATCQRPNSLHREMKCARLEVFGVLLAERPSPSDKKDRSSCERLKGSGDSGTSSGAFGGGDDVYTS